MVIIDCLADGSQIMHMNLAPACTYNGMLLM